MLMLHGMKAHFTTNLVFLFLCPPVVFYVCLFVFRYILKRLGTEKYKEMNVNISFIFLTFLTLVSQSKSNDDLPQIQVTVLTKESDRHVYSSGSLVDVEVGERIYFTCQSKVQHQVSASFYSQVSPIPFQNTNYVSPINS